MPVKKRAQEYGNAGGTLWHAHQSSSSAEDQVLRRGEARYYILMRIPFAWSLRTAQDFTKRMRHLHTD